MSSRCGSSSGSLPGLQALRFAVAHARQRGLPLHAVRVWPIPPPTRTGAGYLWCDDLTAETRRYVNDAFDAVLGSPPDDVTITVAWCSGRIDIALKQAMRDTDMLVWARRPAGGGTAGWCAGTPVMPAAR